MLPADKDGGLFHHIQLDFFFFTKILAFLYSYTIFYINVACKRCRIGRAHLPGQVFPFLLDATTF